MEGFLEILKYLFSAFSFPIKTFQAEIGFPWTTECEPRHDILENVGVKQHTAVDTFQVNKKNFKMKTAGIHPPINRIDSFTHSSTVSMFSCVGVGWLISFISLNNPKIWFSFAFYVWQTLPIIRHSISISSPFSPHLNALFAQLTSLSFCAQICPLIFLLKTNK